MYFHLMGILSSQSNNIVKSNCNDDVIKFSSNHDLHVPYPGCQRVFL